MARKPVETLRTRNKERASGDHAEIGEGPQNTAMMPGIWYLTHRRSPSVNEDDTACALEHPGLLRSHM